MWIHLPEKSINLAMAEAVVPQGDGTIQVLFAKHTATIPAAGVKGVVTALRSLPAVESSQHPSWLPKKA